MLFILSKIFWLLFSPVTLLLIVALIGTLMTWGRRVRTGRRLALAALLLLAVLALTPVGGLIVGPLEDRFPLPPNDMAPPYGVIVLGGAINGGASEARGDVVFTEEGERVVQAAILARRYPDAKLVFTGGNGSLFSAMTTEAQAVAKLWAELGVDPMKVMLEERSRNTDENARFTASLVHPKPDQRWILLTSAFHMPRSMGLFEKAGFNVIADPVAYRTFGLRNGLDWDTDPARNLRTVEVAFKEWVGLIAYRLTGRIDDLFPGPGDAGAVASRR